MKFLEEDLIRIFVSEVMNSDTESDSDHDIDSVEVHPSIDKVISEYDAKKNYDEAGNFVPEEADQISLENYSHLVNKNHQDALTSVLTDLALPYSLSDFQTVSIHTLMDKKDLFLISPTGSGKGINYWKWEIKHNDK